ncbi:MAG: preprotein translocase subunit SecG [Paludibacteraceae bacterium]|nr:preprotein translocase subunit SecG [Paludibacteraceae bacterium]
MQTVFIILIILSAILLILLVLIQNSKGGGLAQGFSSGNTVLGAPKTTDFLEKATWSLVGFMALLCILHVGFGKGVSDVKVREASAIETEMQNTIDEMQQSQSAADFSEEEAE